MNSNCETTTKYEKYPSKNTTVGIIGVGFVGGAMLSSFKKKGMEPIAYDKYKKLGDLSSCLETDIVYLSLPTLYDNDTHRYDKTSIHEICKQLEDVKYEGIVVIKSTVEPGTTESLCVQYPLLCFVHNPEFLTARTAKEDFHHQSHIVLGRSNNCSEERLQRLADFYQRYYPESEISQCSASESEAMKIFVNSFYSVKVQFFNELYQLCQSKEIDYSRVVTMMLKNGWINPMHTQVPGPDGRLSYGGACFPKDTNALLQEMLRSDTESEVLSATIRERNQMRGDSDKLDQGSVIRNEICKFNPKLPGCNKSVELDSASDNQHQE